MSTKPIRAARIVLALGAIGLAAICFAPGGLARPKPPPVIDAPPMPPPMPEIGLGAHFVSEAAAYAGYLRQTAAISPAFTDPASVSNALKTGVAYEPGQLRRGAVAYGAIVALTDQAFVADVRKAGPTPETRYAILRKIFADPASAMQFADGKQVAGMVKQTLAVGGMGLFDRGNAVRQAAYDIQRQPWSLTDVADRESRAAAVKALSTTPRPTDASEVASLQGMIEGAALSTSLHPAPPPYSPVVIHAVALAALAAIGQASDDDAPNLGWLTDDYFVDHCFAEAKLSLYECLAVAKPNYEDVFCLGQHALKDTGSCVVRGAGSTVPIEIATNPIKIAPAHYRKPTKRRRRS